MKTLYFLVVLAGLGSPHKHRTAGVVSDDLPPSTASNDVVIDGLIATGYSFNELIEFYSLSIYPPISILKDPAKTILGFHVTVPLDPFQCIPPDCGEGYALQGQRR